MKIISKRESNNIVRCTGIAPTMYLLSSDVAQCSKDRINIPFTPSFLQNGDMN